MNLTPIARYFILTVGLILFGSAIILGNQEGRNSQGAVWMLITGAAVTSLGLVI